MSHRTKNTVVERPVIVGTIAYWLGKKAEETKTHKWTAYLRGPNNEDLSYFIKKVVFQLHPSFKNPKRVVEQPPFEISESGWGEFEVGFLVYFTDPSEKHVELYHLLKLYPPDGQMQKTKKPVVSETFDVIVFNDPTESFYKKLMENEPPPTPLPIVQPGDQYANFAEQPEIKRITDARAKVKHEIQQLQDRFSRADSEEVALSHEIAALEQLLYDSTNNKM